MKQSSDLSVRRTRPMKNTTLDGGLMARYGAVVASMVASLCVVAASALAQASSLPSNYSYATAYNNQRSMARLSDGTLVLMYQKGGPVTAGNGLVLMVSEDNGATWTQVLQVAAINNVFPDLVPGPGRSIYVVYSISEDGPGANRDAQFAKVEYDVPTGTWRVTRTAFILDAGPSNAAFNAVVAREGSLLWCALRYFEAGGYSIRLYVSADEGATWSYALEADPPGPKADETAILLPVGSKLALIYYHQDSQFRWRRRDFGAPTNAWTASQLIRQLTVPLGSKSGYSVVADDNGQLHLLFGEGGLKHLRTVGGVWGVTPVVVAPLGYAPAVATDGVDLWAVWEESIGPDQNELVMQRYNGAEGIWDPSRTCFNKSCEHLPGAVWCYSATAGTWSDVTLGAGNSISNDVVHGTTLMTLRDPGDALYVGMSLPFSHLCVLLGTGGGGGDAVWEYWNGSAWTVFDPTSGPYAFATSTNLQLWPIIGQGPADWAKVSVNGSAALYYVRARATVAYLTPPRADQVTSYERNRFAEVVARDPSGLTLAWTRGTDAPYAVEMRGTIPWSDLGQGASVLAVGTTPAGFALEQNRPNPFNPHTTIRFSLATAGPVRLTVYDVRGRSVATLAQGGYGAGTHEVVWDGRARGGAATASGVYWYCLEANGGRATRRMILLP
jgi:hypothetical protein